MCLSEEVSLSPLDLILIHHLRLSSFLTPLHSHWRYYSVKVIYLCTIHVLNKTRKRMSYLEEKVKHDSIMLMKVSEGRHTCLSARRARMRDVTEFN